MYAVVGQSSVEIADARSDIPASSNFNGNAGVSVSDVMSHRFIQQIHTEYSDRKNN
jgi:hypothetical protein